VCNCVDFLNLCRAIRIISSDHPDRHLEILEKEVRKILMQPECHVKYNDHCPDLEAGMNELRVLVLSGLDGCVPRSFGS
jgi:hypothetical protein